jgi:hypothetical protein
VSLLLLTSGKGQKQYEGFYGEVLANNALVATGYKTSFATSGFVTAAIATVEGDLKGTPQQVDGAITAETATLSGAIDNPVALSGDSSTSFVITEGTGSVAQPGFAGTVAAQTITSATGAIGFRVELKNTVTAPTVSVSGAISFKALVGIPRSWPSDLPHFAEPLLNEYEESPQASSVRSSIESGVAANVRHRSTAAVDEMSVGYYMSAAQTNSFEDFLESTLSHGTRSFEATHPRTGSPIKARIKGGAKIVPRGIDHYFVSFKIKVLPI